MKYSNLVIFGFVLVIFSLGCASHQKTPRTVASVNKEAPPSQQDPTMINIVNATRLPAANGSLEIGLTSHPVVTVTASVAQLPGDPVTHATLLFVVKNSPEIAGQIAANSEGSEISKKFTKVVLKMLAEGVNVAAASAIANAQQKFINISNLPAEERTESIKAALFEVRDRLLEAY